MSTDRQAIYTTKQIVGDLRYIANGKDSIGFAAKLDGAADRLEQQEQRIAELEAENRNGELERFRAFHERYAEQTSKKYVDDICALTARAEQAERERDALLTDFSTIERDGLCEVCSFGDSSQISKEDCMEDCCFNYRTRRGLPQEGEGK